MLVHRTGAWKRSRVATLREGAPTLARKPQASFALHETLLNYLE